MNKNLILFVGVMYLYVAVNAVFKKDFSTTIIFLGYAFANIGLAMACK